MDFVKFADSCMCKLTVERTLQRSPSSFLQFLFTSVYGNIDISSTFKVALPSVGISTCIRLL